MKNLIRISSILLIIITSFSTLSSRAQCQAYFTATDSLNAYSFHNYSTADTLLSPADTLNYYWWFGDGMASTLANPTHTYSSPGTYTVCLSISNSTCLDTFCRTITVTASSTCLAYFTTTDSLNVYTFNNGSNGINLNYLWDFGDGATSTQQSPTHPYTSSGTYTPCLIITNTSIGCRDTFCRTISVTTTGPCTTLILQPDGISGKDAFVWSNNPNSNYPTDPALRLIAWTFSGTPGVQRSFLEFDLSAIPPGAQITDAKLSLYYDPIVGSPTGHSSQSGSNVSVIRRVTSAWSETTVTWNNQPGSTTANEVTIPQSTSSTQDYPNIDVTNLVADMVANPSSSYGFLLRLQTESYYREMIFGSSDNPDSTKRPKLEITYCSAGPCNAAFSYTNSQNVFTFNNHSTGNNLSYFWIFGDGNSDTASSPIHSYSTSGTYNVCLNIFNSNGCSDNLCTSIAVTVPTQCLAYFGQSHQQNVYTFTNYSLGSNLSYFWNFGDGTNTTDQNPAPHTYATSGSYNVCLYISNTTAGCLDTFCKSITVTAPIPCQAYFNTTNSQNSYTFNNYSTGDSLSYSWSFGDGSTSSLFDPTHTYLVPGNYTPCLIISNHTGCSDTFCRTITVTGTMPCHASFTYTNQQNVYTFQNNSFGIGGGTISSWSFGDGTYSNLDHPIHTFAPGSYTVCLMVDSLCADTLCINIVVPDTNSCHASFSYTVSGSNVTFNNSSSHFTSSFWSFGDGSNSTQQNPSHSYAQNGTYQVCLTIYDTSGCSDNICQNLLISTTTNLTYCLSGKVTKGNASNAAYPATVYLIYSDTAMGTLTSIRTTLTDQNGNYQFCTVPVGKYLIKSALNPTAIGYSGYLPTYFGNSLFWSYATEILLNHDFQQIDIWLIAGNNPGGPGFIGGFVNQGANKISSPGDPLEAIEIMLLDEFDNPVQYTYSDAAGRFEFSNVAYGTYKVYAEVLGIPTYPYYVTISPQAQSVDNISLLVESAQVISGTESSAEGLQFLKVYPNPLESKVFIDFSVSGNDEIKITVSDIAGRTVEEERHYISGGKQSISIDLSGQLSGIYLLKITGNKAVKTFKLLKY